MKKAQKTLPGGALAHVRAAATNINPVLQPSPQPWEPDPVPWIPVTHIPIIRY